MDQVAQRKRRLREQSRSQAIQLLDYLEDYYVQRFPPVRDVRRYRDFMLSKTDLPGSSAVQLTLGHESWMSIALHDAPAPPSLPENLEEWVTQPVSFSDRPELSCSDPLTRQLVELWQILGEEADFDSLSEEELHRRGLGGVIPGAASSAVFEAVGKYQRAGTDLEEWVSTHWSDWATHREYLEKSRSLYKKLFELRTRLEQESESIELVWGFAPVAWAPEGLGGEVWHPLFTVPMNIVVDPDSGLLSLSPDGPIAMDTRWCRDLNVADGDGLLEQHRWTNSVGVEPWDEKMFEDRLRGIARCLDHDSVITRELPRSGSNASISTKHWVLFVRKRESDYPGFLQAQRELYSDPAVLIPAPLAALVVDEPSALDTAYSGIEGVAGATEAAWKSERLLLPLASNAEQERILFLAQHRIGVTAKGPPGTGKSHTIANLISHFVAQGKRVLVTAAKEQALRVLIDKVPEGIRRLCVPVLGADASSRADLQASVTAVAEAAQRQSDPEELGQWEQQLDELEQAHAVMANQLTAARQAETETPPHRPKGFVGEWTPSTAAQWISQIGAVSAVPDPLPGDQPPPLSDQEFLDLIELSSRIDSTTGREAQRHLPPTSLPRGADLSRLWFESDELHRTLGELDSKVEDWEKVKSVAASAWISEANHLEEFAKTLAEAHGTWVDQVLADATEALATGRWRDFVDGVSREREAASVAVRDLARYQVSIPPEISTRELMAAVERARDRFAAGRSMGFQHRAAGRVLRSCSIDGEEPSTTEHLSVITSALLLQENRDRIRTRWDNLRSDYDLPDLTADRAVENQILEKVKRITWALDWQTTKWPIQAQLLRSMGLNCPDYADVDQLKDLSVTCRSLHADSRFREISRELQELDELIVLGTRSDDSSPLWAKLEKAIRNRKPDEWDAAMVRAAELNELAESSRRKDDLFSRLTELAPRLAELVVGGANPVQANGLEHHWQIRQLVTWLDQLEGSPTPSDLQRRLEELAVQRRNVISEIVTLMAWSHLAMSVTDQRRRALNRFTEANRRIGSGKGKYAPKFQAEAREAMNDAKDAVPVWIMPVHKVVSSFRPAADPPFDVVIIDEASQVGLLESLVLGLAKRAIVVGDEKQTSPENVGLDRQRVFDALDRHLPDMRDRVTRFSPDNSLYDIARQQFPDVVQLTEHFRSLPQLIEFSSRHWYDGSIIALRDRPPSVGWQPLGTVFVPSGVRRPNDDTNVEEARAVVALIAELVSNEIYDGMSFGVITLFGTGQARLISGMLLDHLGPHLVEERDIRVGDPSGFQGDERDVIIHSLVIAHDPDRRIGAMTKDTDNRRINVAASRARNQSWVVHSVQPEDLHENDPRRWLLEYHLTPPDSKQVEASLELAESEFEREVIKELSMAGYRRVRAQHSVGGFRIDIVIEGPESRLAVECDGDRWHGPEVWQRDRERQQILERAGWTFERIRGSSFFRDRRAALEPLWERLRELGIPKGDWSEERMDRLRREWPADFEGSNIGAAHSSGEGSGRTLIADEVSQVDGFHEASPQLLPAGVGDLEQPVPSVSEVRRWAQEMGFRVGDRGRLPPEVIAAWNDSHSERPFIPRGSRSLRPSPSQQRSRSRKLEGPRTQEADFFVPILEALVQLGGQAAPRQVLRIVEQRMADRFTPADLEPIPSSKTHLRWDKTANWARSELADLGYLVRPSRFGIWEISDAGRLWLYEQQDSDQDHVNRSETNEVPPNRET